MKSDSEFQQTEFQVWRNRFPWLHCLRVPGIALGMQILLVGFVTSCLLLIVRFSFPEAGQGMGLGIRDFESLLSQPTHSFLEALSPNATLFQLLRRYLGMGSVDFHWGTVLILLIHILSGLIICRLAVSQVSRNQGICLERSTLRAFRSLPSFALSLLFPVLALGGLQLGIVLITLMDGIPVAGPWLAGAFYAIEILLILLSILLVGGLIIGWPLIVASLAAESGDGFDAWSRAFDFLRARFLSILLTFGLLIAAGLLIQAVWGEVFKLVWTQFFDTLAWHRQTTLEQAQFSFLDVSFEDGAKGFIALWHLLTGCLVDGYIRGFYWVSATTIYLCVRASVDRVSVREFDESN